MKVAINRCFGGFGLSCLAEKEYAKRKYGHNLFFYKQTKYKHHDRCIEFTKIEIKENDNAVFAHAVTKDLGKIYSDELPYEFCFYESFYDDELRTDPILIDVIEKLGDKANGQCARLAIVEIPDGTDYEIHEYDGQEHIAEKHNTWV